MVERLGSLDIDIVESVRPACKEFQELLVWA